MFYIYDVITIIIHHLRKAYKLVRNDVIDT